MTRLPTNALPVALRARVIGAAVVGHAAGALVGVVVLAGPARGWSTELGLLLVHVVADAGAGVAAVRVAGLAGRGSRWRVAAVLLLGLAASGLVLWGPGPAPGWLLVRAGVVLAGTTAVALAGRRPPAPGGDPVSR